MPAIAVLDIGKSNAKLALVDAASQAVLSVRTADNTVAQDGPYPHFDVDALFAWALAGLADFARQAPIEAISTTTHGACAALIAGDELALPVLDYEHAGPESVRAEYDRRRGDFAETLSPNLPNGLNLGRQIYWQRRAFADEFAGVDSILLYPQYWAWRLSGAKATEATSLGSHTDLWNPATGTCSTLAEAEGWAKLLPRFVDAWDTVGRLKPEIAATCGIDPQCRVLAGIHDSNASLLPHLIARKRPFTVVSTGTWMITLAVGGSLDRLDATRDCLANVDAFRQPVPSSRAMAGREFEILAAGARREPTRAEIAAIVARRVMALPGFAPGTGPFPQRPGGWSVEPDRLSGEERFVVASLYCALIAKTCLGLAGAEGPVLVEGPFARNRLFLEALAQLVPTPVIPRADATGTTSGAALLALGPNAPVAVDDPPPVNPLAIDLAPYAGAWRARAAA